MKKVVADADKKRRRKEVIAARRDFDKSMNDKHSRTHILGQQDLEWASALPGFNIRRLAYWVNRRSKKISQACMTWVKKTFGSYGGLNLTRHFA